MRYALSFVAVFFCFSVHAERPRMSPMEDVAEATESEASSDGEAEKVLLDVAKNCHNRDLAGFLSNFTSSRSKAIRPKMKKAMEEGVEMRVMSVDQELVDEKLVAHCKYLWDSPNYTDTNLITSEFVLKMEGGRWKIESEKVTDSRVMPKGQFAKINFNSGIAGEDGFVNFEAQRENDEEFPAIPSDVRTYEGSCANGRCGMK